MPVEPESNLHWKAFLYIAGELPSDEASDFERLLLEDQSAREAVAAAVEIVQVVGVLGPEVASRRLLTKRSHGRRVMVWAVSIALAAALLAAALIPTFRPSGMAEPDASEVALTWSGIRKGIDADWSALVAGPHSVESTDSNLAADSEETVETSTERPLPSWLLSAASNPRGDSPQEEN
jgi:hypothetical protein